MAGMGPAPKPDGQRRRRNATVAMTRLPAEGRPGPPLRWPFPGRAPALWVRLSALPQAVAWEQQRLVDVAADYTRLCLAIDKLMAQFGRTGEMPTGLASLLSEKRQLEDRLGLNPMAMLRLRWEVAPDELGARRDEHDAAAAGPAPTRRRFKVVGDSDSS